MDESVTLVLSESLPLEFAGQLGGHLEQVWPGVSWHEELVRAQETLHTGPTLAILALGDPVPLGDPAELAVVWWHPDAGKAPAVVATEVLRAVDAQAHRLLAPSDGETPERVSRIPERVSRADLFRLPKRTAQPLAPIPRLRPELCLHEIGCDRCVGSCPSEALDWTQGRLAILAERCTHCGACVASCPTGAIQSATCGDTQWSALIASIAEQSSPDTSEPLWATCPRDGEAPRRAGISVNVSCIGELGWLPLWSAAAAGLAEQLNLVCPDSNCELRSGAAAAEARWQKVQMLSKTDADRHSDMRSIPAELGRTGAEWRWPKLINAVRQATGPVDDTTLTQPCEPPLGYRLALTATPERSCTHCGACVQICPTRAIRPERGEDAAHLRFEAARCVGCSACVAVCPEEVLHLEEEDVVAALLSREPLLGSDSYLACRGCGGPLESANFIHSVAARLRSAGYRDEALRHIYYCETCQDQEVFAELRRLPQNPAGVASPFPQVDIQNLIFDRYQDGSNVPTGHI
ncbi:MAG: 4Fe-4S binding protein [Acidimicrobiales bacterium]